MFEWKVEEMVLMNSKISCLRNKEKIYPCEDKTSREDKIAFVDSKTDGKLSYILGLIEKFDTEKESLPHDTGFWSDRVKTVSLKAWIKRNDTKYGRPIIDNWNRYGDYAILGCVRNIQRNNKGTYDTYEDLVDEVFHRLLRRCEEEEKTYFLANDEYSVLKTRFREYQGKYRTSFGVKVLTCSNGEVSVYKDVIDYKTKRDITIEELKDLLAKYEQLDKLAEKLTEETNITY